MNSIYNVEIEIGDNIGEDLMSSYFDVIFHRVIKKEYGINKGKNGLVLVIYNMEDDSFKILEKIMVGSLRSYKFEKVNHQTTCRPDEAAQD